MKTIFKAALAMLFCAFMCVVISSCSKEEEMGLGQGGGATPVGYASKSVK